MAVLNGKKAAIGLALASALALGGCYDGYGYGGVSVGAGYYGDGYGGYGGYGDYYGGGYGGYPGYGWYNGFYYPGSGFYVYDRGGTRFRWNDDARRYWEGRRGFAGNPGRPGDGGPNGRPGDGRPGNGQWNPRSGNGQGIVRPGLVRPGTPDGTGNGIGRQRNPGGIGNGTGTPRATRPQVERPQGFTPRAEQSRNNAGIGNRSRNRGN